VTAVVRLTPNVIRAVAPVVLIDGGIIVAICPDQRVADRIEELWTRFGLCDVPDHYDASAFGPVDTQHLDQGDHHA